MNSLAMLFSLLLLFFAVSFFAVSIQSLITKNWITYDLDNLNTDDIIQTFFQIGKPSVIGSTGTKFANVHTYLDEIDIEFALKLAHNDQTSKKRGYSKSADTAAIIPHHTIIELKEVETYEE
jgi:hypothetical protein